MGSQKSKLTLLELIFQTAGAINPPPSLIGLSDKSVTLRLLTCFFIICKWWIFNIFSDPPNLMIPIPFFLQFFILMASLIHWYNPLKLTCTTFTTNRRENGRVAITRITENNVKMTEQIPGPSSHPCFPMVSSKKKKNRKFHLFCLSSLLDSNR